MKQIRRISIIVASLMVIIAVYASAEQKVVNILGPFGKQEEASFNECIAEFEKETGIDVVYESASNFDTLINVRVESGDPPDVTAVPQPGVMQRFARTGKLVPLWPEILEKIDGNFAPIWKELGSYDGKVYGVFHRVNVKSLVWYPKPAFEDAGYAIPTTWDDLLALSQQMVDDGLNPWCVGIESGSGTGWPATDWMEDIMLRTAGPKVYDQWVNHEIPFNDPAVKHAAEVMMNIWGNPDFVLGGTTGILTTNFGDSPKPMFDDLPPCIMHRQGNFITGFFPEDVQADIENRVGVFGLPSIYPQWGTPILGGGDQFVMFHDRPEVRQFMEFLTTWKAGEAWAKAGGALFAYKDQDLSAYPDSLTRIQAELLLNAEVFRFDASDLMPASVGNGSFWTGMVDLVNGKDLDTVLKVIDESWPTE
jgi:alpha-glucoside transport system substrate-binding protein